MHLQGCIALLSGQLQHPIATHLVEYLVSPSYAGIVCCSYLTRTATNWGPKWLTDALRTAKGEVLWTANRRHLHGVSLLREPCELAKLFNELINVACRSG